MTELTLEQLSRASDRAWQAFSEEADIHGPGIPPELLTPTPRAPPSLLDAWADYQIAKRRYERALIRSRRGSIE